MERGDYKRYKSMGPGGWKCTCCGPAPGKEKKMFRRLCKRAERREREKEMQQEIQGGNE